MNASTQYSKDYPGGLCASCQQRFVRVSNKYGSKHAGEFAYAVIKGRKFHVSCGGRWEPALTADIDHSAKLGFSSEGTTYLSSKKPPHL